MSITFTPEYDPTTIAGWRLEDFCGCIGAAVYSNYAAAETALAALRSGTNTLPNCPDPEDMALYDGVHIEPISTCGTEPSINMSNANARMILDLLGSISVAPELSEVVDAAADMTFPARDLSGATSANDFAGRILIAQALSGNDAGIPAHHHPDNERFIECGRRPGYTEARLSDLAHLAQWCKDHNRRVQWC